MRLKQEKICDIVFYIKKPTYMKLYYCCPNCNKTFSSRRYLENIRVCPYCNIPLLFRSDDICINNLKNYKLGYMSMVKWVKVKNIIKEYRKVIKNEI